MKNYEEKNKAIFPTGIAAKLTGIKSKTIINYENEGLSNAYRTKKNRRLFSKSDLFDLLLINYLIREKGLTFKGVKFLFNVMAKLKENEIDVLNYIIEDEVKKQFEEKLQF